MKLFWSSRSPYVRKVMVVAHELGVADRIACIRTVVAANKPNPDVLAHNPLGKLPTLLLDDGSALYDSPVICEYLDTLAGTPCLHPAPGPARIAALRRQALADGVLDLLLGRLGECGRTDERAVQLEAAARVKLDTVLAALETEAPAFAAAPPDIGGIAIGCALSYWDFRFAAEAWRPRHPGLAAWHAGFASRSSVAATEHQDVY